MLRQPLAAGLLVALFAAAATQGAEPGAGKASPSADAPARSVVVSRYPSPGNGEIPAEIRIPSSVGEVVFLHRKHIEGRSIPCANCHHQINAKKLATPHPDYLASSWINCSICHDGAGTNAQKAYACSACHQTNTRNVADETLSAKVVIHRQCWQCHPVGTGKAASSACRSCHAGRTTR